MTGVVTAYQPHYFPRLHYLARAQQADTFVIYDDVQFSRGSPQHHTPIKYHDKEKLIAPVRHVGRTPINEARLDLSERWPASHLQTLCGKYGCAAAELAPFYERLCPAILDIEYLRENVETVMELADGLRGEDLVEECVELDAQWRERKDDLDELREEKQVIEDSIAKRKLEDPDADIEVLVAEAERVNERLSEPLTASEELQERRNRTLVELSALLDRDAAVEWLELHELWTIAGIEPEELMDEPKLVDLTIPILNELFDRFDVTSTVVRSSELGIDHPGDASEYLARMTEAFDGDAYLSGGVGYENYLDEEPFEERGIDVLVQDWEPTWVEGNVCSLDVLFGADDPGQYIR